MFAKVFGQIFDSSIAEDYNCRRMFVDLLILADSDGVVDMTLEAISRRTNVPLEQVTKYIQDLQQPDPASRSKLEQGKRVIPIDAERGWGWRIVNYRHYRQIRDEEARRSYFRDVKRKQRKRDKKNVLDSPVDTGGHCQTVASASSSISSFLGEVPEGLRSPAFNAAWNEWRKHRQEIKKPLTPTSSKQQLAQFQLMGEKRAIAAINHTILKGWQGIKEPEAPTGSNGHKPSTGKPVYSYEKREAKINHLNQRKAELMREPLTPFVEKQLCDIDIALCAL